MIELKDMAEIAQAEGLGTIGTNIFLYYAPPQVDNCIIFYPSNDPPAIDAERPFYIKGKFTAIVRNKNHDNGLAICTQLLEALNIHNQETTQINIKQCRPLYQPRVYRRSESGLIEFSITFQIAYVQK